MHLHHKKLKMIVIIPRDTTLILASRILQQESLEFTATPGYRVRPCLQKEEDVRCPR